MVGTSFNKLNSLFHFIDFLCDEVNIYKPVSVNKSIKSQTTLPTGCQVGNINTFISTRMRQNVNKTDNMNGRSRAMKILEKRLQER